MERSFAETLIRLRRGAGLTNIKLAERAAVPCSLIAGLQSGNRQVGEKQARRIGMALGLQDAELATFIFQAINQCTEKVLVESQDYPAEVLNVLALQLRRAGIFPEQVQKCEVRENDVALVLSNGRCAQLETKLALA